MWHFGSNCWFGVIVPFPEGRSISAGQHPRLHPHRGKASISLIHQDTLQAYLGVLDFFVSTCISDSLLRARACFICCWIILKFVHCMIYPNYGRTRWLTFPKQQMGKVWMFKITKRRVWSHYNKPSNKPRIENKEKNKEYALKTKTEQCCK